MKTVQIIGILLALIIAGCTTPYKGLNSKGQENYKNIEENKFEVTYYGDNAMSEDRLLDYCLLSCAELTRMRNFEYFVIIKKVKLSRYKTIEFYDPYQPRYAEYQMWGSKGDFADPKYDTVPFDMRVKKPGIKYVIQCSSTRAELNSDGEAYEAKKVIDRLVEKYDITMGEPVAGGDATR